MRTSFGAVWCLGSGIQGLGFRVSGVGFRVLEVHQPGKRISGFRLEVCNRSCGATAYLHRTCAFGDSGYREPCIG